MRPDRARGESFSCEAARSFGLVGEQAVHDCSRAEP
jgi:hypothetical protein